MIVDIKIRANLYNRWYFFIPYIYFLSIEYLHIKDFAIFDAIINLMN